MTRTCDHSPVGVPYLVCIVDDLSGGVDPALVVQASACADDASRGTDRAFVEIVGELDAYAADCIAASIGRIEGRDGVVLDLGGVSFISSTGLRCVETFLDDVVAEGRPVWLHDPSRIVRRVLAILGVDRFDICETTAMRHRSLRHDVLSGSSDRRWQWDKSAGDASEADETASSRSR